MYHKEAFLNVLLKWGPLAMAELKLDTEGQYIGAVRVVVDGNVRASVAHGLSEPFRNLVASQIWCKSFRTQAPHW
jgi:hypothetical protein